MAAIWGILSHSESNIQPELSVSMKKRMGKYKIDRIDDLLSDKFYFACGHQYFTPEAVHEILPYHDKERNIFLLQIVFWTTVRNLCKNFILQMLTSRMDFSVIMPT